MFSYAARLFPFAALVAALTFTACSDDTTSPDGDSVPVTLKSRLTQSSVSGTLMKDGEASPLAAGETVDSLTISSVRILVKEIKFHKDHDDSTSGDHTFKSGPSVIIADSAGVRTITQGSIPFGSYDRLKLEFHRFSSSEVGQYQNDTLFGDFVKDDRWSVIITGTAYSGGSAVPFTYRSDMTANLQITFSSPLVLNDSSSSPAIVIEVDPGEVFKTGSGILDPLDNKNENDIDNAIKEALKGKLEL